MPKKDEAGKSYSIPRAPAMCLWERKGGTKANPRLQSVSESCGGAPQTSLGERERKGSAEEKHPQHKAHSTFWISWFLKA